MRKKILLIQPLLDNWQFVKYSFGNMPALGIITLGSILDQEGYQVKIIDARWDGYMEKVKQELPDALMVGFSVMTAQVKNALEVSALIKQEYPDIPVVFGGIHPTLLPQQTCQHPFVDVVVFGEGERTIVELAAHFQKGTSALSQIKGIVYKENGQVKTNEPQRDTDLDSLPYHNFDLFDYPDYIEVNRDIFNIYKHGDRSRMLPVYTGLGCPHRCAFCFEPYAVRRYRSKSPERILDECECLVKKHHIDHIYFRNDNFFVFKKEVQKFLQLKMERGLTFTWDAQLRANYFNDHYINDTFMEQMKKAGMRKMMIGAESGSPRVLKILKKDITVEQILHSARMAYTHSLEVQYPFIVGTPGETEDDLVKTIELIQELREVNPFVLTAFFLFRPYPGSELYHECIRLGMKEPKTLEEWSDPTIYDNINNMPWIGNRDFCLRVFTRQFPSLKFTFFHMNSTWFHYVILDNLETSGITKKEDLILLLRDTFGYSSEKFLAGIIDLLHHGWIQEHQERIEITEMGVNRLRKLEEVLNHETNTLKNRYEVDFNLRDYVEHIFQAVDRSSTIVVWGAGTYGVQILKTLKRKQFTNTKIVDINLNLQGSNVLGHEVLFPAQVFKVPLDYIIISSRSFYTQIEQTLISTYAVSKEKIINPFIKSEGDIVTI